MIDKICEMLTQRIKKEMPEMTKEREEAIYFGLQNIIGEFPKIFVLFLIAFILKIGWLTIFFFFAILPYRTFSGGFHLKTHIGCIIGTSVFFCGNVLLSKYLIFPTQITYIIAVGIWIFSMIMIRLYAPADTENIPIISKKQRKKQQILSYITMTLTILAGILVQNSVITNILVYGVLLQSLSISRIAYKITNNKYGYEEYTKLELENATNYNG